MAIEVFNRFEFKYQITKAQSEMLIDYFNQNLNLDEYCKKYGSYRIFNRYIDTINHNLIRKSISKPAYKQNLELEHIMKQSMKTNLYSLRLKRSMRAS